MITTVLNTKIAEVENKILDVSALVTTTISNTKIGKFENRIPSVIDLVTKADYNAISDIEAKYVITSD